MACLGEELERARLLRLAKGEDTEEGEMAAKELEVTPSDITVDPFCSQKRLKVLSKVARLLVVNEIPLNPVTLRIILYWITS